MKRLIIALSLLFSMSSHAGFFRNSFFLSAVKKADVSKVEKHLRKGADINARTVLAKKTAIMLAVEMKNHDLFELLLSHSPNLRMEDKAGKSALYKAVEKASLAMVSALVENGASPHARTKSGDSPLKLAKRMKQALIIAELEKGTGPDTEGTCLSLKESSNPPAKSVNIVFVPSGFSGDLEKYKKEVGKIVKIFSSFVPFNNNIDSLDISISLLENDSKNNYCHFNCSGIERLLCCTTSIAKELSKGCTDQSRQTVVVHNDTKYGGAGYSSLDVATTSINSSSPAVAIHELGHSLFNLSDEYTYGNGTPSSGKNCSHEGCGRWQDLIDLGLASCQSNGCKNGNYYTDGDTIMKTLSKPFKAVNERLACCIYAEETGSFPAFCGKYIHAGEGLKKFCGVRLDPNLKQLVAAPLEIELALDNEGRWKLVRMENKLEAETFERKFTGGDAKGDLDVKIELGGYSQIFNFNKTVEIEYFDEKNPRSDSKMIKEERHHLRLIIDLALVDASRKSHFKSMAPTSLPLRISIGGKEVFAQYL